MSRNIIAAIFVFVSTAASADDHEMNALNQFNPRAQAKVSDLVKTIAGNTKDEIRLTILNENSKSQIFSVCCDPPEFINCHPC